jgi:hypothetical protein
MLAPLTRSIDLPARDWKLFPNPAHLEDNPPTVHYKFIVGSSSIHRRMFPWRGCERLEQGRLKEVIL